MPWNLKLSQYLTQLILKEWTINNLVEYPSNEEKIAKHIHQILSADLNKEKELETEVKAMLDELEKTHTGQFERHKMRPLLKKKLAQKKGIIL